MKFITALIVTLISSNAIANVLVQNITLFHDEVLRVQNSGMVVSSTVAEMKGQPIQLTQSLRFSAHQQFEIRERFNTLEAAQVSLKARYCGILRPTTLKPVQMNGLQAVSPISVQSMPTQLSWVGTQTIESAQGNAPKIIQLKQSIGCR